MFADQNAFPTPGPLTDAERAELGIGGPETDSPPLHPGEILREEFLVPLNMSAGALAKQLNVPRTRIERVAAEQSPITIDTALRLSRFFGGTAKFWINLQTSYDLEMAARAGAAADLSKIKPYAAPSAA